MPYKLPKLPYDFNSLEPYIDTRTMTVHYRVHHSGFVDELNQVLEGYEDLQKKKVYELLYDLDSVPEEIRPAVRYNGGGHANHSIFWQSLSPSGGGEPDGHMAELIDAAFGSFGDFKHQFNQAALTWIGSGWIWLCVNDDETVVIKTTPNEDNPLSEGLYPLLGLDLWEHAYYLNYDYRRDSYVDALWNLVNWENVSSNYYGLKAQAAVDDTSAKVKGFWNKLTGSDD